MAPHGSVAPWGAAGGNPAVFPTQGVRFLSDPRQQCASRLTGRAPGSYPGEDWVRGPGRARIHAGRSSAGQSNCLSSRRPRVRVPSLGTRVARRAAIDRCPAAGPNCVLPGRAVGGTTRRRSPMERAPAYEAGGCRFDPCRRRHLAVAQGREHRPPKAGVARSNRAGEAEPNPAPSAVHGRDPAGSGARLLTGYGVTPVRVRVSPLPLLPRKRPGWMRSLSRKQVRVSRHLGVRVAPLPLSPRSSSGHDAGFSSRKPGFDSPSRYAIDARWSSGTDVRLLPGRRAFNPLSGSHRPVAEHQGTRLQTATRG